MRRMTPDEAVATLYEVFEVAPDTVNGGLADAFMWGMDADTARRRMDAYLDTQAPEIDAATVEITPDTTDDSDTDCCRIIIRTETRG